jgi:inorganic triphosphatase YgiF
LRPRDAGEELELKLTGAPADVAALARSKTIRALASGPAEVERISTTYFDTEDERLAATGVTLRLREDSQGLTQTIKRGSSGGESLSRVEEERRLRSRSAFPLAPEDARLAVVLPFLGSMTPASKTVSDRTSLVLKKGRTRIEAALDLGRIEAMRGGRLDVAPLAEFELELIDGDPEALFRIARDLIEESDGRVRPGWFSKAEQARRLKEGAAIRPEGKLDLAQDVDAAAVLAGALRICAARVIELAPAIVELREAEGIHQMRVALRRLRVVERLFRRAVSNPYLERLAHSARQIAEQLAPARDLDVFFDETIREFEDAEGDGEGLQKLQALAAAARAAAWNEAAAAVGSPVFALFALDLLEAAHLQHWRAGARSSLSGPARDFAEKALEKRHKAAQSARGAMSDDPATRHDLRIAIKKLRYAAQSFRALYPSNLRKPFLSAMSGLQDELGRFNDAIVAARIATSLAGEDAEARFASEALARFATEKAERHKSNFEERLAEFDATTPFWRRPGEGPQALE